MPRHKPARRARILQRDKWICYLCGADMSKWPLKKRGKGGMGGDIWIDHVVPVAQGGTHADDNLAAACRPCNQSKGDRRPDDYARDDEELSRVYGATVADGPDHVRGDGP